MFFFFFLNETFLYSKTVANHKKSLVIYRFSALKLIKKMIFDGSTPFEMLLLLISVVLFNSNNSISYESFVYMQLNGFKFVI